MDIDRYIAQNVATWDRLDDLAKRAARRVRSLTAPEIDELVHLYEQSSAHLAFVRTHFDDAALVGRLSLTLGSARGAIYRRRQRPARAAAQFLTVTLPAAVWDIRRVVVVAAVLFYGTALVIGLWLSGSTRVLDATVDPATQQVIVDSQFESYYKSSAAEEFAARVTTNNIQVSFLTFAGGVFIVPTVMLLFSNGLNLGVMAAVMHHHGAGSTFWGLITPHGLIETTALCFAAAAGLRMGWAFLVPGERLRSEALAEEGRRCVVVVLGCMILFVAAGITEAFVTPSGMPTATRVGIGVVLQVAALAWLFGMGRNAAAAGATGLLGEQVGVTATLGH